MPASLFYLLQTEIGFQYIVKLYSTCLMTVCPTPSTFLGSNCMRLAAAIACSVRP